jgi:hypothetical protein
MDTFCKPVELLGSFLHGKSLFSFLKKSAIVAAFLLLMPMIIYAQPEQTATRTVPMEPAASQRTCTSKHSFIVRVKEEISAILNKIKAKITGNGGNFDGNTECGSFASKSGLGTIKGGYRSISVNEIEITIEDKPFLVPYSRIESEIKKALI